VTTLQNAARLLMATRLIDGVVREEIDAAKVVAQQQMQATGAERVRVSDEQGHNLGTVTLAAGRVSARVVDEAALLAWVKRNHASEVVETVRESFLRKLLDGAVARAEAGDSTAVGPDGEVLPGVEVVEGERYVVCRPTPEARDRMRTMLANSGLLALPAAADGGVPGVEA